VNLPLIELLSALLGMLIGAEERVSKLVLAKLADNELSRGSSIEQEAINFNIMITQKERKHMIDEYINR